MSAETKKSYTIVLPCAGKRNSVKKKKEKRRRK